MVRRLPMVDAFRKACSCRLPATRVAVLRWYSGFSAVHSTGRRSDVTSRIRPATSCVKTIPVSLSSRSMSRASCRLMHSRPRLIAMYTILHRRSGCPVSMKSIFRGRAVRHAWLIEARTACRSRRANRKRMAEPSSSKPAATGSPFWRFSLGFYRRSGVADACITLQERSGVDVNLLLYLLWQASQGRAFAAEEVAALEEVIGPWRAATVIPLRMVRRALKEPPGLVARPAAEVFRNKIKAVELEA